MADYTPLLPSPGRKVFPRTAAFGKSLFNPLTIPGGIASGIGLGALGRLQGRPERYPTATSRLIHEADEMLPGFERAAYEGDYRRLPSGVAELAAFLWGVDPLLRKPLGGAVRGAMSLGPAVKDIAGSLRPMHEPGEARWRLGQRAKAATKLPQAAKNFAQEVRARPGDVARVARHGAGRLGIHLIKAIASRGLGVLAMVVPTNELGIGTRPGYQDQLKELSARNRFDQLSAKNAIAFSLSYPVPGRSRWEVAKAYYDKAALNDPMRTRIPFDDALDTIRQSIGVDEQAKEASRPRLQNPVNLLVNPPYGQDLR